MAFALTLSSNALSTAVFPVPAGASKKNARLSDDRASGDRCAADDVMIELTVLNTVFCSVFNVSYTFAELSARALQSYCRSASNSP